MSTTRTRKGLIMFATVLVEVVVWAVMVTIWWSILRHERSFRFDRPWMLWALLIGPVLVLLFLYELWRRDRAVKRFSSSRMIALVMPDLTTGGTFFRFLAFRHGLGFVVLALTGPQFGTRIEEVKAKGVDVVVALDVSNSMTAEDLRPSRIEVAARAMSQLVDKMHGDRIGIVVFAGEAFVQLPITSDKSAAKLFLSSIGPNMVPTQGTAIGAAIDLAQQSFDPEVPSSRAIIVITDGENHEDDAESAARAAAEAGTIIHTIGMGTPEGGPIPIRRNGQVAGFKKDKEGRTVVSKLDETMLRRIAAEGNGAFVRATQGSTGINELVDELRGMDQADLGTIRYAGHKDRYQIPLALGCALLVLSMVLPERRIFRTTWTNEQAS